MKAIVGNLNSVKLLNSTLRNPTIDFFRAIAILSVVLAHFNQMLPFGGLGVDLFFVISGYLVGGLLLKKFNNNTPVKFFEFILERGLKIWPSFYTFILLGNFLAFIFLKKISPDQIIPFKDLTRYVLFYQNFTGPPHHWSFDHIWSLCIEEHFYVLFPLLLIALQKLKQNIKALFTILILIIIAGIVLKFISLYLTVSRDTYSGTQNRIDALAWGVLLKIVTTNHYQFINRNNKLITLTGVLAFALLLVFSYYITSEIYQKIIIHVVTPFSFFLMLMGLINSHITNILVFRIIAYYSYNWYLWHQLVFTFVVNFYEISVSGFVVYLTVSFLIAVVFTILIEEPIIKNRNLIVKKIFPNYLG